MAFDDPDPRDALAQARARLAGSSPDDPQAVLARVRARLATAKDTFARPEVAGFDLPPVEAVPRVASDATAAPRATPVAGPTLDIQRPTPITTEDVQRAIRDRALARAAEFTHVPMPVINAARGAVGGVAGMAAIPVGAVLPGAADYLTAQAERIQPAEPSLAADVGRLGGGLLTAGAMAGVTGSLAAEALPETLLGKLGQALASDQWVPRSLANAATFAPVDALEAVRRGRQTGDWGQAAEDFAKNSAMNLAGAAVFEGVRQPFMEPRVRPGAAPEVGFKPEEHPTAKVSAETAADIVDAAPPPDAPPAVGDMGRSNLTAQLGELETEAAALRAAANDVPVGDPLREKFLQAAAQADAHRQRLAGMGSAEGVTITPGERLAQERIAGNPDPVAEARAANPLTDTDPARERARALEAAQGPALPPEAYVGPERRMRIESISADDILNQHRRAADLPPTTAPLVPRVQSGTPRTGTVGGMQSVTRADFTRPPVADEAAVLERLAMQERSAASELAARELGTPPRMEGVAPILPMPGTKGRTKLVGGDEKFRYTDDTALQDEYDAVLERLDANNKTFNAGTTMWTRDDPNLGGVQRSGTSISGEAGRAKGGVSRDATYLGRIEEELNRRGIDPVDARERAYAARAARAKAAAAENLPASLRESQGPDRFNSGKVTGALKTGEPVTLDIEHSDMNGAQWDALLIARDAEGRPLGGIDFSEYEGKPSIKMIEVKPAARRKGVATALYRELERRYPGVRIDRGMSTPEGTSFLKSILPDLSSERGALGTTGGPGFKVTPELRTALSKGQSYGHGATTMLSGITGAGFGGATGYAVGDTPEERRRNAILGALAGAAIGGGLEVGLTKLLDRRAPLFPGGKPRLTPEQVEQIATTGRMPHDLPPAGKTAPEDYAHIASFATDPDGTIRLREELRRAGPLTRGDPKTVEPWTVVRHIANDLGFHDVMMGDVKRLNRAEMLAIRDIVHTNIEHINANVRRLQTDPTLSQAERTRLGVLVQGMEHQNVALLDRFIVARGETGRNLNAMKMFAMSTMDPVVWLAKAQQVVGGPVPDELRTALVKALGEGDREGAIKLLMDARTSTIGEKATTYWKANLLSNPLTHVVNISSNAVLAGSEQAKNVPAAMVDYLMGLAQRGQRTTSAFTVGMTRASKEGVGRGMRGAWKTITTGLSPEQGLKYDIPRQTNYDSRILQLYTESIFRTLGVEDQVFREFALSASLANQATTMARAEGFRGKLLRARVEELRLRPSDEMAIRAIGDAEEAVVRDQTRIGRWLQATAKHLPGGQFIAPFTRTPGAVATRLAEYSPLYGLPVGSYRTARVILKGLKGEQVPIEVQREAAKLFGRGATGTAIVALGAYLASKGLATGPAGASPSARQTAKVTGRSGSSIRLGDLWTDVSRVTPVGMLLALGAGMYEIHQSADTPAQELGADAFAAVKTVTDQPFLQGISQAIEGIQTLDPLKAAEQFSSRLGEGIVAGFIPASSLLAAVARGTDSVQRQTDGLGGYLATRVPGLAERQAPTVTAFGQPTPREGGLTNQLLNPLRQTRDASADPVVRAMLENGIRVNGLAKKKDETAEQFATRAMAEGQAAYAEVARTIQKMQWRLASPEERASLFDQAFQRGRQRALTKLQRQGVIPRPPRARFGGTR